MKDPASMPVTIGFDIGGTNLRAAVVTDKGEVLEMRQIPTPSSTEYLEHGIIRLVQEIQSTYTIKAVGLAIAGFLAADKELIRFAPHLPWRGEKVGERLSAALGLPVVLEHDANAAAWGEQYMNKLSGIDSWVFFAIGTGIGGALMLNGELYRGSYGTAPEFGHITVLPGGRSCPCGRRGCLERYCSGSALTLTARELMAHSPYQHSRLARDYAEHPEELSGRAIVSAAREGDELALHVVDEFSTWLGRGLAMVQDILDPRLIILGGGVSQDSDIFLEKARAVMKESIVGAGHRPVAAVQTSLLGSDAGMIGVALLAHR